jgi:hypothetical protein
MVGVLQILKYTHGWVCHPPALLASMPITASGFLEGMSSLRAAMWLHVSIAVNTVHEVVVTAPMLVSTTAIMCTRHSCTLRDAAIRG